MSISPSSYNEVKNISCYGDVGINGFEDTIINSMEDSFELSPNFEPVYLVNDSSKHQEFLHDNNLNSENDLELYKSWVFDGTEDKQTVGTKMIQMYPYDPPILEIGDYVCWDYYKKGIKSTWLTVALDAQTIYEQIGSMKMCTNEMRFYNEIGELIRVPCVFDDAINSEKNTSLANLKYINGIVTVYMQHNRDSEQIKPNQRFLFGQPGNWTSFRVVGVGVNNFMNQVYWQNGTSRILEITMEGSYVNYVTDDVVNGIADAVSFSVSIDNGDIENITGTNIKLNASVCKNGEPTLYEVGWESSDSSIASISKDGNLLLVSDGEAKITAYMKNNREDSATIYVKVSASVVDSHYIAISPYGEVNYGILQGDTQVFSCYMYKNGEVQSDNFTFKMNTHAQDNEYKYSVIDANHFEIKNIRMSSSPIIISCSCGDKEKTISVILKGGW